MTVKLSRFKRLQKKAKKGFRGHPVGTIAFYGPDEKRASKVVVGVVEREGSEPEVLERWFSEDGDVRIDSHIAEEILACLDKHAVKSVSMIDRIIGCPHEEGIDYDGETCLECPFWARRDRFTGRMNQ